MILYISSKINKMKFPIISFAKNDPRIYAHSNEKDLKTISKDSLNVFNEAEIIDSDGNVCIIEKAEIIGWGTLLWGYNPLLKGRIVKVELKEKSRFTITLDKFKEDILTKLSAKGSKNVWYHPNSIDELKNGVESANSFIEIINLFLYGIE